MSMGTLLVFSMLADRSPQFSLCHGGLGLSAAGNPPPEDNSGWYQEARHLPLPVQRRPNIVAVVIAAMDALSGSDLDECLYHLRVTVPVFGKHGDEERLLDFLSLGHRISLFTPLARMNNL
jgi:hypothetical protein